MINNAVQKIDILYSNNQFEYLIKHNCFDSSIKLFSVPYLTIFLDTLTKHFFRALISLHLSIYIHSSTKFIFLHFLSYKLLN